MTDGEGIRRFIRAAGRLDDPELAQWIASMLWGGLSRSQRRGVRDDLLRLAARRLPPESAWRKAHMIADLARRPARPGVGTPAELVALAMRVYRPEGHDQELSAAQVFRVIRFPRISPMAMQEKGAAEWNEMLHLFERTDND